MVKIFLSHLRINGKGLGYICFPIEVHLSDQSLQLRDTGQFD